MSSAFRATFDAIRTEVETSPSRVFDEARPRHRCLARHATVLSVLAAMSGDSPAGWAEREALTEALSQLQACAWAMVDLTDNPLRTRTVDRRRA